MAPYLPPPEPSSLLPPLLACLPAAYASSQPPPAILPLLSPILRQRVQVLSGAGDGSSQSSWLPLLCWESSRACELTSIVESYDFEPHPVSGEIEVGDINQPLYRRLDEETLQSTLEMPEMGLKAIYLWCESDPEGGNPGWRLSELRPLKSLAGDDSLRWSTSIREAGDNFNASAVSGDFAQGMHPDPPISQPDRPVSTANDEGEDDYWARYDNTPSRTPAAGLSTSAKASNGITQPRESGSEAEYYAKYSAVQPELDHDDPSVDRAAIGDSTLNGNEVTLNGRLSHSISEAPNTEAWTEDHIIHTRPSSSSSSMIQQLEQSAESQSHAELAIQQHISTSVKSLFRLARGAGVTRAEFERLVQTELEVLGMMEDDE